MAIDVGSSSLNMTNSERNSSIINSNSSLNSLQNNSFVMNYADNRLSKEKVIALTENMNFDDLDNIKELNDYYESSKDISPIEVKDITGNIYLNFNNHQQVKTILKNEVKKLNEELNKIRLGLSFMSPIDVDNISDEAFLEHAGVTREKYHEYLDTLSLLRNIMLLNNVQIKKIEYELAYDRLNQIYNSEDFKNFKYTEEDFYKFSETFGFVSAIRFEAMSNDEKKMFYYLNERNIKYSDFYNLDNMSVEEINSLNSYINLDETLTPKMFFNEMEESWDYRAAYSNVQNFLSNLKTYNSIDSISKWDVFSKLLEKNNDKYLNLHNYDLLNLSPDEYEKKYNQFIIQYDGLVDNIPVPDEYRKDYNSAANYLLNERYNSYTDDFSNILNTELEGALNALYTEIDGIQQMFSDEGKVSMVDYQRLLLLKEFENSSSLLYNAYSLGESFGKNLPSLLLATASMGSSFLGTTASKSIEVISGATNALSKGGNAKKEALYNGHESEVALLYGLSIAGIESMSGQLFDNINGYNINLDSVFSDNIINTFSDSAVKNIGRSLANSQILGQDVSIEETFKKTGKDFLVNQSKSDLFNAILLTLMDTESTELNDNTDE